MTVSLIQSSFTLGEVAPALFGRTDLARYRTAASTFRNGWVNYRGGYYSRAGTAFVGFSKQTGRAFPPRLVPFQFSINQGLALEFGNFYMRVVSNGAFVLETPISITGATQANPCVITAAALGASTASPNDFGVLSTPDAPGEMVTLAGGVFATAAVLAITNTKLLSLQLNSPGSGVYAPADTITLAGGTQSTPAVATVLTTQVVSATIANAGTGGTDGTQVVTGTTGTGTKFQANVTVAGGVITAINSISRAGSYTANPSAPSAEPVTGASLSGAELDISIGVLTFSLSNAGIFTANAPSGAFTQASTSGSGTGATFQFGLFGPNTVSVSNPGVYTTFPSNPVAQASSDASGTGATFTCTTTGVSSFSNGDWVYVTGVNGMTQLNGETYVIAGATTTTFQLKDVYGNNIDSTAFGAYTSGGTVSRVYTLQTPYSEEDLEYLKFTQSADVMSVCCVNQETQTEYPPQDLSRLSDVDWVFTPVIPNSGVSAPTGLSGSASSSGSVDYQYCVTAVNPADGTESVASTPAAINSAVNIAGTAGSISLKWNVVAGVNEYNIYKATPGFSVKPPVGAQFGFAGSAYGTQFVDSNITADFTQVPPQHKNPFAQGQVIGATPVAGGSGYTSVTLTISTGTGSGASLEAVIVGGSLVAILVNNAGEGYLPTDTIGISGNGTGATAVLTVGPSSGTYPSVPIYFQERRVYGNSLNNPDTYWMSQPGAFTNFDSRLPTISSDAIVGSPWSLQVNGIQFMVPTAGGLLVFTGLANWLLVGAGSFATNVQAITPSTQVATPQPENGCSSTVPPIKINYDVLYVSSKGSFYFDQPYQLYALSEPIDLTENSSHLFVGYTVREHAWCQQPYKLVWAVRSDGTMLSLTFLKQQEVAGWARHDTQGLFQSVCSIVEPPVDALYLATQRFPGSKTAYMIERMDNRMWASAEDCWCVDCGLSLAQPTPNATLSASSAAGLGACSGVTGLVGGSGYSASTIASVVDDKGNGPGTGAVPTLTIVAGVITGIAFSSEGTGYIRPALVIYDPANTGSGASATITLDNSADFTTTAGTPFASGDVGKVIRMGGGIATVTSFVSSSHVVANIASPIVAVIPNTTTPQPQTSGNWTMTAPVTTISGLNHLIGATVTGLADGNVIPPTVVSATGTITLATAASAVTVGLGFQAQLQTIYLDAGEPTIQGERKKIAGVTARIESSRGIKAGSNQPDGSTLSPAQIAPTWHNLATVSDATGQGNNFPPPPYNSNFIPLRTGDVRLPLTGGFATPGQVCFQQDNPLPLQVLAVIPEWMPGDTAQLKPPQQGHQ